MKKRALALTLCASMLAASLAGCGGVKTRDEVKGTTPAAAGGQEANQSQGAAAPAQAIDLQLLFSSSDEQLANVLRDQLTKAGFNVKLNMQPDYSSYKTQLAAGNYDMDISGWTTVTGNPDYAVRSLFKTGGDYNVSPIADPKVDELIEKAGTETPEQYVQTYSELEKYMIDEMAYIVPLASLLKTQAVNTKRLNQDTVRLSKSRSMCWEAIEFADSSLDPATEPLRLSQTNSTLTSLDPIKGNDGSINMLNTNMYVRLVNLTDDDKVVSDGSLSYNYAIADGNQNYYFLLRDDINFARVQDGHAVDSGVLVGGEDVVYSLERAKNKDSVPNHKTYSLHENINTVSLVTDLSELEGAKVSGSGETVKAALEKDVPAAITSLVDTKDKVDNAAGAYQVVKVTTVNPFPQVLNYLAHQSAGIVDQSVIEAVNTYDIKNFDIKKDICYGDQSTVTEGATYNNTLSCSGPYVMIKKNDYEVTFEANPAYRAGSEYEPHIKNVNVKFYKDLDSSLSGLRSGEIDVLYSIPENSHDLVRNAEGLALQEIKSNSASYCTFNLSGSSIYSDPTLRRAVLAAINQEELLAVFNGSRTAIYSTVSPLVDTGNKMTFVPGKSQELQAEYLKNKNAQ